MLIVWFGIDMASKVFLGATLVFFITFFNTLAGNSAALKRPSVMLPAFRAQMTGKSLQR